MKYVTELKKRIFGAVTLPDYVNFQSRPTRENECDVIDQNIRSSGTCDKEQKLLAEKSDPSEKPSIFFQLVLVRSLIFRTIRDYPKNRPNRRPRSFIDGNMKEHTLKVPSECIHGECKMEENTMESSVYSFWNLALKLKIKFKDV